MDKYDNDPVRFLQYVYTSINNVCNQIKKLELSWLQLTDNASIESVIYKLVKEISDSQISICLVLDDYHNIDQSTIHKIIESLIGGLPANLKIVISTRVDLPFPIARLRVDNNISELRIKDLSFTENETTKLFNEIMKFGLSAEEINLFQNRSEGWIAGLQLAALSLNTTPDKKSFIQAFAGDDRHVIDYLVEEVLETPA